MNLTARRFEQTLRKRIAPHGVQPAQFGALVVLREEGPLSQTALSERLSIEQPTMANTLSRMERDGLVQRQCSEADRRVTLFRLTPKAVALLPVLEETAAAVNAEALEALNEAERTMLFAALKHLIRRLEPQDVSHPEPVAQPADHCCDLQ
ncbi:MarR family winged helix-turn-helix transcriptional regulator [Megalodesulfovibrio paquesii]